jgi:hypothetical protein
VLTNRVGRTTTWLTVAGIVPLFAGGLMLAGCTANPKAASAPAAASGDETETSRAVSTSSRTPTQVGEAFSPAPTATVGGDPADGPPLRPVEADGLTIPAAESFVHYYFATLDYLKATGDGSATRKAAEVGCRSCNAMLKLYATMNVANQGIAGDYPWRDVKVSSAAITDPTTAVVAMAAHQGTYSVRASPKSPLQTVKPKNYALKLTLSAKGNQWVMFDVELESDK